MAGVAGTVTLPSRSYRAVPARPAPAFPAPIPGGQTGLAPLPSMLLAPPAAAPDTPSWPTAPIPGGHVGPVRYFVANVDKQAPYVPGNVEGFSVRSTDGTSIWWRRFFFRNMAGAQTFQPQHAATPAWSANAPNLAPPTPAVPVPHSTKRVGTGGLFREFFVDEQLFDQLTDRGHPWPILKPVPLRIAQAASQAHQRRPYFYQLTRYSPAASYGQTAQTLLASALSNLLPATYTGAGPNNPPVMGGSPYGSY